MRRLVGIAAGVALLSVGAAGVAGAIPTPAGIAERICGDACDAAMPRWLAGWDSGWDNGWGNGWDSGWGNGRGDGWRGSSGPGSGSGTGTVDEHQALPPAQPGATITDAVAAQLLYLAEEEKLAGDVYDLAAARYGVRIFDNIARSEATHLAEVRVLLDRYDLADPTAATTKGTFQDPDLQALYDRLAAQVAQGWEQAVAAGLLIERTDIADLQQLLAEDGLPSDVHAVVAELLAGSQRHLAGFERQS